MEIYPLELDEFEPHTFFFTTDYALAYQVNFVPSGYLFPNEPDFEQHVFEMLIKLVANLSDKPAPPDPRIPPTIAAIFKQFLDAQNRRAIVYICDSSDGRQHSRARKFAGWFYEFRGTTYLKLDGGIMDKEGITYHTAIILRVDNPNKIRVFEAFDRLIAQSNDKS